MLQLLTVATESTCFTTRPDVIYPEAMSLTTRHAAIVDRATSTEMIFLDASHFFFHRRFISTGASSVKYVGLGLEPHVYTYLHRWFL